VEDLQATGKPVTAPQFPLTSLADDVARLRQAPAWRSGPTIAVGHSPRIGRSRREGLACPRPRQSSLVTVTVTVTVTVRVRVRVDCDPLKRVYSTNPYLWS
jgi:hypothetical protein